MNNYAVHSRSNLYFIFSNKVGIPKLHWTGKDGDFNVMIIDLLGHSLEDLFTLCSLKFSLKTVLLLAE